MFCLRVWRRGSAHKWNGYSTRVCTAIMRKPENVCSNENVFCVAAICICVVRCWCNVPAVRYVLCCGISAATGTKFTGQKLYFASILLSCILSVQFMRDLYSYFCCRATIYRRNYRNKTHGLIVYLHNDCVCIAISFRL